MVSGGAGGSAPRGADTGLRIGPDTLRRVDDEIRVFGGRTFSALLVRGLTRRIGGTLLLDDVRFTVFTGEVVALVGPSGSGKSSIVALLERFYVPTSGAILLDGKPLEAYDVAWLRAQPGLIQQEPSLFADSVRYNI